MRPITQQVYGIPPEQVMGSSIQTTYQIKDGKPVLMRLPKIHFIEDKAGKPVGINEFIGRRPVASGKDSLPETALTPFRSLTYYTLFGLLAATGLRISEALRLRLDDVTVDGLLVRKTKFHKSRLVPLQDSTDAALRRYLEQRNAVGGGDDHVFISTTGGALTYAMVNGTFHYLIASSNLASGADRRPPRIHDLRHYFALEALKGCNGGRDAVARHMLALSTYLGHAHVADTYWYL
jgi:integrase